MPFHHNARIFIKIYSMKLIHPRERVINVQTDIFHSRRDAVRPKIIQEMPFIKRVHDAIPSRNQR